MNCSTGNYPLVYICFIHNNMSCTLRCCNGWIIIVACYFVQKQEPRKKKNNALEEQHKDILDAASDVPCYSVMPSNVPTNQCYDPVSSSPDTSPVPTAIPISQPHSPQLTVLVNQLSPNPSHSFHEFSCSVQAPFNQSDHSQSSLTHSPDPFSFQPPPLQHASVPYHHRHSLPPAQPYLNTLYQRSFHCDDRSLNPSPPLNQPFVSFSPGHPSV